MLAKWFLLVGVGGLWAASVAADDQIAAPKAEDSYVQDEVRTATDAG
jgi:hypothetical protein